MSRNQIKSSMTTASLYTQKNKHAQRIQKDSFNIGWLVISANEKGGEIIIDAVVMNTAETFKIHSLI